MNLEHKWYLIAYTTDGNRLLDQLTGLLEPAVIVRYDKSETTTSAFYKRAFSEKCQVSLVAVGALGIAIRSMSPYVKDKLTDPAVIVIDDQGKFVISALSGHAGGANHLCESLSVKLKGVGFEATAVITTASDIRGVEGIESVLTEFYVPLNNYRKVLKTVNMHIAEGGQVEILFDPWLCENKSNQRILGNSTATSKLRLAIALRNPCYWLDERANNALDHVFYSRSLVVGTGSKRDLDETLYESAFLEVLRGLGVAIESVKTLSSITLKAEEACMLKVASKYADQFVCHGVEQLSKLEGLFEGSTFVKANVGVTAVAGPSAYILTQDEMSFTRYKKTGCTFALGRLIR
ncbi:MAG: hypothetical protein BGO41_07000 [Clostridiales bacterium 38-18]|nr:MAG: hypothetical protein BGO41_07000 [Clostridiales bacterium 38-18]